MIRLKEFWGLRLLALAIAMVLWLVFSIDKLERTSERVIEASVTYNTPGNLILLAPVNKVSVRLRGPDSRLRSLNPFTVTAVVEIARERETGSFQKTLGPDNILVPEGFEVVSVEPSVLNLQTDERAQALMPVIPTLVGEPAAGAIAGKPVVDPTVVLVTGPRAVIEGIPSLRTTEIDLTSHAITFEEAAAVITPDPLVKIVDQSIVRVRIPMTIPGTEPPEPAAAPPSGS